MLHEMFDITTDRKFYICSILYRVTAYWPDKYKHTCVPFNIDGEVCSSGVTAVDGSARLRGTAHATCTWIIRT